MIKIEIYHRKVIEVQKQTQFWGKSWQKYQIIYEEKYKADLGFLHRI
jgi:hypothetical protein